MRCSTADWGGPAELAFGLACAKRCAGVPAVGQGQAGNNENDTHPGSDLLGVDLGVDMGVDVPPPCPCLCGCGKQVQPQSRCQPPAAKKRRYSN